MPAQVGPARSMFQRIVSVHTMIRQPSVTGMKLSVWMRLFRVIESVNSSVLISAERPMTVWVKWWWSRDELWSRLGWLRTRLWLREALTRW